MSRPIDHHCLAARLVCTWILATAIPCGVLAVQRPDLVSVLRPRMDEMEVAVRQVLTASLDELETLTARSEIGDAELAERFGEVGKLLLVYSLPEAARSCLINAHRLAPSEFQWLYLLGALEQRQADLEAAVRHLDGALALRPRDAPAQLRRAQVAFEAEDLEAARRGFAGLRERAGYEAAADYGLGRIAAAEADWRGATEHFEQALAVQPEATEVAYQLAIAYRETGDRARARTLLATQRQAKLTFPDPVMESIGSQATGASIYIVTGNRARRSGDFAGAIEAYRQAIAAEPDNLMHRRVLASTLLDMGDIDSAIAEYGRVLQQDPSDVLALYNLGTIYSRQGRPDQAIEYLRRAVDTSSDHVDARVNLAELLAAREDIQNAVALYREAIAIDPYDSDARIRLAELLTASGNPAEAVEELATVLAVEPENLEAWKLKARALGAMGAYDEAADSFASILAGSPADESAHFGRSIALLLAGRDGAARQQLEAGLTVMPGSLALAHLLARLLATSEVPEVRDGTRALSLAREVFQRAQNLDHAETLAMALAEVGEFVQAVQWQREIIDRARSTGQAGRVATLEERLALYEQQRPCRSPWRG